MINVLEVAKFIINWATSGNITINILQLQNILYLLSIEFFKQTGLELFDSEIQISSKSNQLVHIPEVYFYFISFGLDVIWGKYDVKLDKATELYLNNFLKTIQDLDYFEIQDKVKKLNQ